MQDLRLQRIDATRLQPKANSSIPVNIFANDQVPIEPSAVTELLSVLTSENIQSVAVTPDFHKGAGIPIGTVLKTRGVLYPQAIGNDINCGMRLHTTSLDAAAITPHLDRWETIARHLFFEGGRQIPMTGRHRETLLRHGLSGLFHLTPWDQLGGQWQDIARQNWHRQLDHIHQPSFRNTDLADAFTDWVADDGTVTYDDQIGSIGGGNHFVEIQRVETIFDRQTAYAWGLRKGTVALMIHSGSVGIGHIAGRAIRHLLQAVYPTAIPHPVNGIYPLADTHPAAPRFWRLLQNAANFAFANRMFLAASAVASLERVLGQLEAPLLYDSPHNLVWETAPSTFVHRKGATPARGPEAMDGTPFHYWGEPVLVPGSMGASSFVLAGRGNPIALESASHGAGRALARGEASRTQQKEFDQFLRDFRIVTPLDLRRPDLRSRADIVNRKITELRAEGPHAYKGIRAIIDTLEAAQIAKPIAELVPIATIKG